MVSGALAEAVHGRRERGPRPHPATTAATAEAKAPAATHARARRDRPSPVEPTSGAIGEKNTIHAVQRERGLALIIAYKLVKGVLWLVLAAVMVVMMRMGLGDRLTGMAERLQHHAHAWSIYLGRFIARAASLRGQWFVLLALVADGVSSLVEGWALYHGHWWGPWLVVVLTASLMPFEVVVLARHPTMVRSALLALNAGIVWYLTRSALAEHRRR